MNTTRRQFFAAAAGASVAVGADRQRPNILLIITDQQRANMMSCAGNPYLKTPNIDSLAANGVRFERAYCTNPVCTPSRFSLMTGHLSSEIGMECNEDSRFVKTPRVIVDSSLSNTFQRAGYKTVYGGKVHLPPAEGDYAFETITADQRASLADESAAFLRQKHDQPFLMVSSFINPHDICYMAISAHARATNANSPAVARKAARAGSPAEYLEKAMRLPDGVSVEEFYRRYAPPLPANHDIPSHELSAVALDKREFQLWVRKNWTDREWRMHRWAYARLTEQVDREIGKVLSALRESGRDRDTLVIMTTDHGDQDSAHRLEHKEVLYEEATRIPFIVSWKGVTRAGIVDREHLISNGLDLIPTLCDFAGIEKPAGMSGVSVRPLAEGKKVNWRDHLVIESHLSRGVQMGRWKYFVGRSEKHSTKCGICLDRFQSWDAPVREMLIDLEKDPGEMNNLATDTSHRNRLMQGRQLLSAWYEKAGVTLDRGYTV